jgi:L-ascorbate metabolism protein UlaG (beta-lactamase superfamily)
MKITQVRNATLRIEFGGARFLVDPVFADKDTYPGFRGTYRDHLKWPTVDLPLPLSQILDVDAVIVTHTHEDHWDKAAAEAIRKDIPIFAQHAEDALLIGKAGFTSLHILSKDSVFQGVSLIKTPGQHGSDETLAAIGRRLGEVCGVLFKSRDEKTLYLAGDTTWNRHVEETLLNHSPDVVVLNSGDARIPGLGSIIMNKEDVYEVFKAAPRATLIASHMEAVNHAALTRPELRDYAVRKGMMGRLLVPEDGETLIF